MDKENKDAATGAAEKQDIATAITTKEAVKFAIPKGKGKFKDKVTVKGTSKHPTLPGKEFKVHRGHIDYLSSKGFIEKVKEAKV